MVKVSVGSSLATVINDTAIAVVATDVGIDYQLISAPYLMAVVSEETGVEHVFHATDWRYTNLGVDRGIRYSSVNTPVVLYVCSSLRMIDNFHEAGELAWVLRIVYNGCRYEI